MCASSTDDLQTRTLLRLGDPVNSGVPPLQIVVSTDTTEGTSEKFPVLQMESNPHSFPLTKESGQACGPGNPRLGDDCNDLTLGFTAQSLQYFYYFWKRNSGFHKTARLAPTHTRSGRSPNKNNNKEYFLRISWPK